MKRLERRDSLREQAEQAEAVANSAPTDLPITELELNTRFENILDEAGIKTVGDILAVLDAQGDEGILNLSGIGQQALLEIKKGLRRQGHDVPMTEA
ncbi:MAG: DNA-directed RNA polymerase subunit alpha C-terminal domain-containing protein [Phototrophicaceae bacterium]